MRQSCSFERHLLYELDQCQSVDIILHAHSRFYTCISKTKCFIVTALGNLKHVEVELPDRQQMETLPGLQGFI